MVIVAELCYSKNIFISCNVCIFFFEFGKTQFRHIVDTIAKRIGMDIKKRPWRDAFNFKKPLTRDWTCSIIEVIKPLY